jgi:hypothetical protein
MSETNTTRSFDAESKIMTGLQTIPIHVGRHSVGLAAHFSLLSHCYAQSQNAWRMPAITPVWFAPAAGVVPPPPELSEYCPCELLLRYELCR